MPTVKVTDLKLVEIEPGVIELINPDDFPEDKLDPRIKMFGFSIGNENAVEIYNPQNRSSMTVNADELPFFLVALLSYHQSIMDKKNQMLPAAIPTAVLIRHLETAIEFSERALKNTGNVFHKGYNRAFQHILRDIKEQHFLNYTKQS